MGERVEDDTKVLRILFFTMVFTVQAVGAFTLGWKIMHMFPQINDLFY